MTSVKLRTSWTDENAIIEGVRIYKMNEAFDVNTRPLPLVELTNGEEFYEDFDVTENETVYYMLSCFLGEQEVFTECFEVEISTGLWLNTIDFVVELLQRANEYHLLESTATRTNFGLSLTDANKWTGIVTASNGKLYGVPNRSANVLVIDPETNTATRTTLDANLTGVGKWYGGVLAPNGKIYCVPRDSNDGLRIDSDVNVLAPSLKYCLSPHINKF